jgi:hypothetical protein
MYKIRAIKKAERHYGIKFPEGSLFIEAPGKLRFVCCSRNFDKGIRVYMSNTDNDVYTWTKGIIHFDTVLAREILEFIRQNGFYLPQRLKPSQCVGLYSCIPKERRVGYEFREHSHIAGGINDMEVTFHECYWSTGKNRPQVSHKPAGTKIRP